MHGEREICSHRREHPGTGPLRADQPRARPRRPGAPADRASAAGARGRACDARRGAIGITEAAGSRGRAHHAAPVRDGSRAPTYSGLAESSQQTCGHPFTGRAQRLRRPRGLGGANQPAQAGAGATPCHGHGEPIPRPSRTNQAAIRGRAHRHKEVAAESASLRPGRERGCRAEGSCAGHPRATRKASFDADRLEDRVGQERPSGELQACGSAGLLSMHRATGATSAEARGPCPLHVGQFHLVSLRGRLRRREAPYAAALRYAAGSPHRPSARSLPSSSQPQSGMLAREFEERQSEGS
jgi:hypothetical protein